MADDSGGSGFMGLIAGLLIAVIVIVGGFFLFNGGFGQQGTDINVQAPEVATPG
jgi:hypothetical protein